MIILRVACDNLYMFKNFEVDFTYNRQISHSLCRDDKLFPESRIKVRKSLIILGANASGKTTFGKLLCLILNFICRKNLDSDKLEIETAIYDKNKLANFEVEFVVEDTAYLVKAVFSGAGLQSEKVHRKKIYKTYDIFTLRNKIMSTKPLSEYDAEKNGLNLGFQSYAFTVSKNELAEKIRAKISFWFRFSEDNSYFNDYEKAIDVKLLNKFLPSIDTSVKNVQQLSADGDLTDSYIVNFCNGDKMTVPDGNLRLCPKRLSHGTFEAIDFISMLSLLSRSRINLFYIDEILAHMNPELEANLIRKALTIKNSDCQIFFTTHNNQIFELNAPINSFMFFKRNEEGFNEVVYPSEKINKNDRNLRGYYENDYFNVLPDYSILDLIFSKDNSNE